MKKWMTIAILSISIPYSAAAMDVQGVLADWVCVKSMVQNGREKTLKQNSTCSLNPNYSRQAYGIITDDNHYYKLDDAGRGWALKLLKDSPSKNNLKVIATGDVQGDTLHVTNMSEL